MRDKKIAMEFFHQIEEAVAKVVVHFQAIHQVVDFTNSPTGVNNMSKE